MGAATTTAGMMITAIRTIFNHTSQNAGPQMGITFLRTFYFPPEGL
jgi:hypothetical protein